MKKRDLKQGAIVQIRDGSIMILIGKRFVDLLDGGWLDYYDYTEDLIDRDGSQTPCFMYDIVKVFNPTDENIGYIKYLQNNIKWDWEREEIKEMTVEEISKALGYEVKIVREVKKE